MYDLDEKIEKAMTCLWKVTREENLKGIGTTFANRQYVKCDDCTGREYERACYVKQEDDDYDLGR